jgi:hypothetical protein
MKLQTKGTRQLSEAGEHFRHAILVATAEYDRKQRLARRRAGRQRRAQR